MAEDIFVIHRELAEIIDSSNLEEDHSYFTKNITEAEKKRLLELKVTNRKRLKTLGWECPSQIKMFVGHKPKLYAILLENNSEIIKIKGVTKKNLSLRFDHFYRFLLGPKCGDSIW